MKLVLMKRCILIAVSLSILLGCGIIIYKWKTVKTVTMSNIELNSEDTEIQNKTIEYEEEYYEEYRTKITSALINDNYEDLKEKLQQIEKDSNCKIGVAVISTKNEPVFLYNENSRFISNCTVKYLLPWYIEENGIDWSTTLYYSADDTYSSYANTSITAGYYSIEYLARQAIRISDNRAYETVLRYIGLSKFQNWIKSNVYNSNIGIPVSYGFMGYATPYCRSVGWAKFKFKGYYDKLPKTIQEAFVNANPSDAGLGPHKGGWYHKSTGGSISECGIDKENKYAISIFMQKNAGDFSQVEFRNIAKLIKESI